MPPWGFFEEQEEEMYHSWQCVCETCIQNHPEREILLGIDEEWLGDDAPPPEGQED
jgi:hypothetical protein